MLHWNQTLHTLHWPLDNHGRFAGAADAGDIGDLWRFDSERRALQASRGPVARAGRVTGTRGAVSRAIRSVVICGTLVAAGASGLAVLARVYFGIAV